MKIVCQLAAHTLDSWKREKSVWRHRGVVARDVRLRRRDDLVDEAAEVVVFLATTQLRQVRVRQGGLRDRPG